MKVWIDADACPVVNLAIRIARAHGTPVALVCDDAHQMQREGAETITVLRGADSADWKLVQLICPGDLVITQDYGLAALCLARGARAMDQNGREYTEDNIDSLLGMRHVAARIRRGGGRLKGPPKREKWQDEQFADTLENLLTDQKE